MDEKSDSLREKLLPSSSNRGISSTSPPVSSPSPSSIPAPFFISCPIQPPVSPPPFLQPPSSPSRNLPQSSSSRSNSRIVQCCRLHCFLRFCGLLHILPFFPLCCSVEQSTYVSSAAFRRLDPLKVRGVRLCTGIEELLEKFENFLENNSKKLVMLAFFHSVGGFSIATVACSIGVEWAACGVCVTLLCAAVPIFAIAWCRLLGASSKVSSFRIEGKNFTKDMLLLCRHVDHVGSVYNVASPVLDEDVSTLECPGTPPYDRDRFNRESEALRAEVEKQIGYLSFHKLYTTVLLAFSLMGIAYAAYMTRMVYTTECVGHVHSPPPETFITAVMS